jgi:hypothetical protein
MKEHISNQTRLVHKPYDVELFGGDQAENEEQL